MNIFGIEYDVKIKCLFPDAEKSARSQCDKHVVKMPLESAQMLCTVHRVLDGGNEDLYKIAHPKHPSTLWTMESDANYMWHYRHWMELCKEYTYRYGKVHKSWEKFGAILSRPPKNIPKGNLTPFRLAFKSNPECVVEGDPVKSYQNFYMTKQSRFDMKWTKREIPNWFLTNKAV
jgi:hypothetical protein